MRIGVVSTVPGNAKAGLDELVAEAKDAESKGFAFLSVPNIFGLDAIGALTVVVRETSRIELATGVVPTPPRHPSAMAQQALTAQAASSGRFVLGIGLSHKIVIENMLGLSYAKPALQMREYLEVLMPLVQGRQASFQGELYRVNAGVQVAGAAPVPVVVAALGPRMLKVAGTLADGTATWMTGVKTLENRRVVFQGLRCFLGAPAGFTQEVNGCTDTLTLQALDDTSGIVQFIPRDITPGNPPEN